MSRIDAEPGVAVAVAEPGDPAVAACAVCPHPIEAHDTIARRFCAATKAGMFNRGCVCTGAPEQVVTTVMRVRK
ncbi:RGCVC family protein [Amycolatopsis mongoliensis]|uniref:RGCVC family protein n=1 Tax=Amycolatopsis mongoliensis TaxID=715475 RepID=A0A9Y2JNR3_9PSEU|nr:RGCVC family protein [Amycolatopsis sp. 4-36]WIY00742.1 RGCVC family protein [Amycolatopsis sp. 4-36]